MWRLVEDSSCWRFFVWTFFFISLNSFMFGGYHVWRMSSRMSEDLNVCMNQIKSFRNQAINRYLKIIADFRRPISELFLVQSVGLSKFPFPCKSFSFKVLFLGIDCFTELQHQIKMHHRARSSRPTTPLKTMIQRLTDWIHTGESHPWIQYGSRF